MKKRPLRLHVSYQPKKGKPREWWFEDFREVTIGYGLNSSICVPETAAEHSRKVFLRKRGTLFFRFTPDLTATLQVGNLDIPVPDLRDAGLLYFDQNAAYVALREKTSGTLVIGKTTFKFWVDRPEERRERARRRPIAFLKYIQPSFLATLFLSILLHLLVFKGLMLVRMPEPSLHEVQERYARFSSSQVSFIKQQVTQTDLGDTAAKKESKGGGSPKNAGGFLAAVASSRSKPSSPFSRLFATNMLGKSLQEALQGKSLEEAVAKELKERSPRSAFGETQGPVGIGSLRQGDLARAEIKVNISGPNVATLSAEAAQVEGTLDRAALERLVQENAGQLRDCYERSLERNTKLGGKVIVALTVLLDGRAKDVGIPFTNIQDSLFQQCIITRVSAWRFPKPVGAPTPVRFPFIFSTASRG